MDRNYLDDVFLSAFFSDETERFRSPSEPEPGQEVSVRIRAPKVVGTTKASDHPKGPGSKNDISIVLIIEKAGAAIHEADSEKPALKFSNGEKPSQNNSDHEIPMHEINIKAYDGTDFETDFAMYEASFDCPEEMVSYYFRIEHQGKTYIYQKDGIKELPKQKDLDSAGDADTAASAIGIDCSSDMDPQIKTDPLLSFGFTPGFHIPEWSRGAVQYQIFPDRFYNGDPSNDVRDGEYSYNYRHVRHIANWRAVPDEDDYRCYYGGDIAGIIKKLDYLQELGVEVIYLNPIFLSPSSHKYDTQDYEYIDPHFGIIKDDEEYSLKDWEYHNGYARRYIKRVTSKRNLLHSNAIFAELCQKLHNRGMKIILDGVFNHCGSFHRWMDREGIYREKEGFEPGAYQDKNSPYREFFRFTDEEPGYEAWWDVETLPKLDYENSRKLWDTIFAVAEKWLSPPYSIDGWRLDVAADLGHSLDLNHRFWKEFRQHVKAVNPQAIIIAEHYGDPSDWLKGDEWDTVMNYSAFMEPVTYFLTGMEKHSDGYSEELYQDGEKFFKIMQENMANFQHGPLQCAMNELSNHDHSRFLTRTNRTVGRTQSLGAAAADKGIDKAVLREAVVIQMTWPGAPTIYYGDEAGLAGWTDPDNRRCYPWGYEDKELIELHRELIDLRRQYPVLKTGSVIPLGAGKGWIAYARFDEKDCIAVVCNNNDKPQEIVVDVSPAEAREGDLFTQLFSCSKGGHSNESKQAGIVKDGKLQLNLAAKSAIILSTTRPI